MDKKPERRGSATSGQTLAAQYSQLLGMKQLGTELMASVARVDAVGNGFARAQRTGNEVASSVLKSQKSGAELVANVIRAQGTGESFARTQRLGLEMVSSFASTQRLAGVFASAQALGAAQISRHWSSVPGLGDIGVRAVAQALTVHIEPLSGMRWFNTAMQAGGVPQLAGVLPPMLRNWDLSQVFRPLLESPEYRPLGAAGEDLAQWVAGRLSGSAEASTERFEEIAGSIESIELDAEFVRQLEEIAQDEPEVRKATKFLGLSFREKSLGARAILALSTAAGLAILILMIVGGIWAPALTEIISEGITKAWTGGAGVFTLLIAFSPRARAQIMAMGYRGLGDSSPEET